MVPSSCPSTPPPRPTNPTPTSGRRIEEQQRSERRERGDAEAASSKDDGNGNSKSSGDGDDDDDDNLATRVKALFDSSSKDKPGGRLRNLRKIFSHAGNDNKTNKKSQNIKNGGGGNESRFRLLFFGSSSRSSPPESPPSQLQLRSGSLDSAIPVSARVAFEQARGCRRGSDGTGGDTNPDQARKDSLWGPPPDGDGNVNLAMPSPDALHGQRGEQNAEKQDPANGEKFQEEECLRDAIERSLREGCWHDRDRVAAGRVNNPLVMIEDARKNSRAMDARSSQEARIRVADTSRKPPSWAPGDDQTQVLAAPDWPAVLRCSIDSDLGAWLDDEPRDFCSHYCQMLYPSYNSRETKTSTKRKRQNRHSSQASLSKELPILTSRQEELFFRKARIRFYCGSIVDNEILRRVDAGFQTCRGHHAVQWREMKAEFAGLDSRRSWLRREALMKIRCERRDIHRVVKRTPAAKRRRDGRRSPLE